MEVSNKIVTLTSEEVASIGMYSGVYGYDRKISQLLVEKGISEDILYSGSKEISGFWDRNGTFYCVGKPGGIRTYCPKSKEEKAEWIKELEQP